MLFLLFFSFTFPQPKASHTEPKTLTEANNAVDAITQLTDQLKAIIAGTCIDTCAIVEYIVNPNCTGLFRSMIIRGGGGGGLPLQISAPIGPRNLARTSEMVQRGRPQWYFSQKHHILFY